MKRIRASFFRTAAGGEPVRDWLKGLKPVEDRKQIGLDIQTVEFGWPVGMPVCARLAKDCTRFDPTSAKTGSHEYSSMWMFVSGWFCYTDL